MIALPLLSFKKNTLKHKISMWLWIQEMILGDFKYFSSEKGRCRFLELYQFLTNFDQRWRDFDQRWRDTKNDLELAIQEWGPTSNVSHFPQSNCQMPTKKFLVGRRKRYL